MDKFLQIPVEFQAMLVAGYFGYWISTVGINQKQTIDDRLFQIISYGFLGLIASKTLVTLADTPCFPLSDNLKKVSEIALMFPVSITSAVLWRKSIRKGVTERFRHLGIHANDHCPSTLASVINESREWSYIQLHMSDGRVVESDFEVVAKFPTNPIIIDDDGNVAIYVTKIYRANDTEIPVDPQTANRGYNIQYYPASKIDSIEICWK